MRCNALVWLWCMWHVRRRYKRYLFSKRAIFMKELRPRASSIITGDDKRFAYPDALFWVTPSDVRRAIAAVQN